MLAGSPFATGKTPNRAAIGDVNGEFSDTAAAMISAEALGKIGKPAAVAVPDLLKLIEANAADSPSFQLRTRETATHAIGEIGPKGRAAAPRLLALLDQASDPEFKTQLAIAVIRIDPPSHQALSEIEKLMQSPNAEQRLLVLSELEKAGVESKPVLSVIKAAQNDKDEEVRSLAKRLVAMLEG